MTTLQRLYELIDDIETVHVVCDAEYLSLLAKFDGEEKPRGQKLPRGHYLILRLVDAPLQRTGLFAVVAPKPAETLGGNESETLGGKSLGGNTQ